MTNNTTPDLDVATAQAALADIRNACDLLTRAGVRLDRSGLRVTADKVHDLTFSLLNLANATEGHLEEV